MCVKKKEVFIHNILGQRGGGGLHVKLGGTGARGTDNAADANRLGRSQACTLAIILFNNN